VDKIYRGVNGDGYGFAKVRIRIERVPVIADKFSSRHGQKGTIGMIVPEHDMPQTADGVRPDIIINPHAIPSRMTIAQLVECLLGKAGAIRGSYFDAMPFQDFDLEGFADILGGCGMER